MTPSSRRLRRIATSVVLAGVAAILPASGASAGPLVSSATDCAAQSLGQPFLPWADPANYTLLPGGDAESSDGWSLGGGASVGAGNEPWNVTGADDSASLTLPAGSSATSSSICAGIEHPTVRFFARSSSASMFSALRVEVLFEDAAGDVHDVSIGYVGAAGSWAPSAAMPVVANLLALLPGEHTAIAFRFTPQGSGSWRVDDVYVDPYARN